MYDVVGIGNAVVDVIARAEFADIERLGLNKGAMTLVEPADADRLMGEMTIASLGSGGSVANSLAAMASLGADVAFVGKVRDDEPGRAFERDMAAIGVACPLPPAADGPSTARCLIFVTPDADRTMQTSLGVSCLLGPADVDPATVRDARVTYLEGYLFDLDLAKKAFVHAAELAHAAGRKVALTLSDPFCVARHRAAFRQLVAGHVDILFANGDEIVSLYEADSLDAAIGLVSAEIETAAITRGAAGSVIVRNGERHSIDAEPVADVVDTTGAGDLYAAGVLFGLTRGYEPDVAGRIGAICAAEIIGHYGARPEAPLDGVVGRALG